MNENLTPIDTIKLSGTKEGKISISTISEPYGKGSENVASIGISLQSTASEPDWKVHIPKTNIDAVIQSLILAKESL